MYKLIFIKKINLKKFIRMHVHIDFVLVYVFLYSIDY